MAGLFSNPTRRTFLKGAASLAAGGLVGCGGGDSGGGAGGAGGETNKLEIGIIALTDCSPFVIAHEKGFFKKHNVESVIKKQANWKAVQDNLAAGSIQMTHMLIGMPIASTMGLLGSEKVAMIIPWLANRNGQAITLKADLKGKVGADPKALKPIADAAKAGGKPMTFAMTFPPGTHAMWMRYWLAAGGINPGGPKGEQSDITLIPVPPPQMVENMKLGQMDGFCVGEPWNARAVEEGIGYTAITTQDIWKDHPEKVCAFTKEFADKNPTTVKNAIKALHEASVWLDDLGNRDELVKIVSATGYINCKPEQILGRLKGEYDYGDGRKANDPNYMIFNSRNCNYPQPAYCKWWLTQLRRWGFTDGAPDYEGVAKEVMRPDIYEAAMKELGATGGKLDETPFKLFDGSTFDPKGDCEKYAKSFAVHAMKG
ncbi:myristoyl transferase [Limnoglobus roseus]|uniref:Myristoyl transferase n=2 Tax=Limnoglobus roseus TaxID=2598579 RepID=A0A5C1A4E1_9BACT|nr:myristoyl transferase [Limnoglobus roseus]